MTCTPWVTSADAVAPCDVYGIDTALLDKTMGMAGDILYGLTGRKYPGVCTDTVRPLAQWRANDGPPPWWQFGDGGSFYGGSSRRSWCSCNRSTDFGCSTVPEIWLPGSPVDPSSVEVLIDGVSFVDFRVDDGNKLVRTDGGNWICCQSLLLDDTQPGTMSVTYEYGTAPPAGGKLAAAVLGCQLYLAVPGAAGVTGLQSELPKRVTSIVRQGVTLAVIDPLKMFADGQVGIPFVDLWVASDRLANARRRATVSIPGRGRRVRRVG